MALSSGSIDIQDEGDNRKQQATTGLSEQPVHTPSNVMSVAFRNLSVHAFGRQTDYQRTVSNFFNAWLAICVNWITGQRKLRVDILHDFDGFVSSGEMLLVLGNPGSGCTTLLKSLAGQTYDLCVDSQSLLNYQGLSSKQMFTEFRGKGTYQAEFDIHFPTLTMRETLEFASKSRRLPRNWNDCRATVESVARTLGLTKALDVKMGNALVPGVSGGERKRTSIAEILLGDSVFQCWDNSTRGLDSVNALDFIKTLRRRTSESGSVAIVTLYQAGEDIYDLFDKVTVIHEGRQIYFGRTRDAKKYFTDLGFIAPPRSTSPEFLTSITRPIGLRPQTTEDYVFPPRTAAEFAEAWKDSSEYKALVNQIDDYNQLHLVGRGNSLLEMRRELKGTEKKQSPYILPVLKQIALCMHRGFLRLRHNLAVPISTIMGNMVTSIILGSMFYNMPRDTSSFFGRTVLLFFTSLVNTTLAAFESVALWDDRPIIEKHVQYGFYHAFSEAIASFSCDLPNKLVLTFVFNFPLYFLSNLRRTPGAFFTYYLFGLMSLLNGSVIYRSMGAMSRTLAGSQPPGAVLVMLLTIYSGFVVPFREMRPWLQWFSYINPVYYVFEAMVVNEFSGREFDCATLIPQNRDASHFVCSIAGAMPGNTTVLGDAYIEAEFGFQPEHLWRNLGIVIALLVFFAFTYVMATEYITMLPPRSDILLFQRGHTPSTPLIEDEEMGVFPRNSSEQLVESKKTADDMIGISNGAHLLWTDLSYAIKEGKNEKVILNNIDGWVKPRTLTALMGPSGAGKTTLLNVLAERTTIGIVTGNKITNTRYQNVAFARKIGYAQQDDIHLPTTSVREALTFSALLRQPEHYSKAERIAYVDHVIGLLNMEAFQHAVVGRLNVEQKKRVTIGTELAARPELLLFLDEPTSGLDSDSVWSFCTLLRQLADSGQAILCTIHQPSGPLLTLFDRLLFLKEGHAMYFGDFGPEFRTLIQYFEDHGARKCLSHENPAEWMMEVTSDGSDNGVNWADIWTNSSECITIRHECQRMRERLSNTTTTEGMGRDRNTEFATSFWYQLRVVTQRAFQHDWRSPEYLYSKSLTTFGCAFINGVSFWASGYTSQDIQNQIFSLFLLSTIFGTHVQLIMERFYHSRLLYENRERQSRTYSWLAFLISNIVVELSSQTVISVIAYVAWYYPVGFWRKAIDQGELNSRSGLVFLLIWSLLILFQTLSQMLMTIMPDIPTGINNGNLLFMLSLIFSGVLVPPDALPRFWIFMYRATPLSYYISAIISTGLSGSDIYCSSNDLLQLDPPSDQTCGSYLSSPTSVVLNPDASAGCQVCPYTSADALLAYFGIYYDDRWWQYGVTIAYNVINVMLAILLYWLVKVPKGSKKEKK
ncbi:BcatrD protein [Annulohypoxylon maeteangense]|uniref:BcatrD protein n=1 Tax=Annulohypoxylon maeteangense TaxID=1927788 RepID=UPI00200884BC|nr:BcatrD protein [Annulohypoxylon maeteangense]KAI0890676.1 BcatrD protein [Annulohypoxylon maeteangense]